MSRRVLIVLVGGSSEGEVDHYQVMQAEDARRESARLRMAAEIVLAPGFDHLRIVRGRLRGAEVDAVVVEPVSVSSAQLILKELAGRVGLVLLNSEPPDLDAHAHLWGAERPFGTVSTPHRRLGEIQGRQASRLLGAGGEVLCVTGPERSSAAVERLAGLRAALPPERTVYTTEAGEWTESAGATAFEAWYRVYRSRSFDVGVIAAQSDELAMGARAACERLTVPEHRQKLARARLLGIDACPAYGARLVDEGRLAASIRTPANAGEALRLLARFWDEGQPLPLRAFTLPEAYPIATAV